MIQRVQTIFFLLAIILGGLYLYSPVIIMEYPQLPSESIRPYEMNYFMVGYFFAVFQIAVGISMGANLLGIVLVKFPTLQKLFSVLSILNMLFCVVYAYYRWAYTEMRMDSLFYYGNIIPWIIIVLNILAIRSISKDEQLLKSYDRLR